MDTTSNHREPCPDCNGRGGHVDGCIGAEPHEAVCRHCGERIVWEPFMGAYLHADEGADHDGEPLDGWLLAIKRRAGDYAGEWLAVHPGLGIIAHGRSLDAVRAEANAHGVSYSIIEIDDWGRVVERDQR